MLVFLCIKFNICAECSYIRCVCSTCIRSHLCTRRREHKYKARKRRCKCILLEGGDISWKMEGTVVLDRARCSGCREGWDEIMEGEGEGEEERERLRKLMGRERGRE